VSDGRKLALLSLYVLALLLLWTVIGASPAHGG
jgi:hypothetical protein